MKLKNYLVIGALALLAACANSSSQEKTADSASAPPTGDKAGYVEYTIDGQSMQVAEADILTTYNKFGDKTEFKIFVGKEDGPTLLLTIPNDMSKPSSTPNGSSEPGNAIAQGSLSLQGYPAKEYTFNNYDFLTDPKPTPVPNAITVTSSEKIGDKGRVITGTFNTTVLGGENKKNDPAIKDRVVKGKFKVIYLFKGDNF